MRKTISILMVIIMISMLLPALALADDGTEMTASLQVDVQSGIATVIGNAPAGLGSQISFLVTSPSGRNIYIGQETCGAEGGFALQFSLGMPMEVGKYIAAIGGVSVSVPLKISFNIAGHETSTPTSGSGTTLQPENIVKPVVDSKGNISLTITPKLDNGTGTAAIEVNSATLNSAFDMAKANESGVRTIEIEIPKVDGAKAYETTLPTSFMASDANREIEIKTGIAAVMAPGNMLAPADATGAQKVSLTIAAGDKSGLDDEVQAQIGNRPIIELNLKIDGKKVSWSNESAPVKVTIPYTPAFGEDPEHIMVWYIDGQGNAVSVPNGRYDPATGSVTFTTTHFSKYAVAYVMKTYGDLADVAWAKKQIEVLSSKGIIRGVSENEYSPKTNITRADFLGFLVMALGVDARVDGNFDDISKDAYYYREIGVAKKIGITNGTGNNLFSPDDSITRQDMMTLTDRALKMLKKIKDQGKASDIDKFTDKSLIASYAKGSVATLVKEGLIVGDGIRINSLDNTTRAEAAVFLYRIYNMK